MRMRIHQFNRLVRVIHVMHMQFDALGTYNRQGQENSPNHICLLMGIEKIRHAKQHSTEPHLHATVSAVSA